MSEINSLCIVCMDLPAEILFENCNHLVLCKSCASHAISRNNNSCPKCRTHSENLLTFSEIEILNQNDDEKKEKYSYKNFVNTIDFPIYFVLKKHMDKILNEEKYMEYDEISSFSNKIFCELTEIFVEIKNIKTRYVYFSRTKSIIKNIIRFKKNEKQINFSAQTLGKLYAELNQLNIDFVNTAIKEIKNEYERKKKENDEKRNSLSASLFQIEEYVESLQNPLRKNLYNLYLKNIAPESILDNKLDEMVTKYNQNLISSRLIKNLIFDAYNDETKDDTEIALNDILNIVKNIISNPANNKNIKSMKKSKLNEFIMTFVDIISVLGK
jgi:hypothetical protein